jgi:hypothetical protein
MIGLAATANTLWVILAWTLLNVLPGFAVYHRLKRGGYDILEAFGLSIVASPVLNSISHAFFGYLGAPILFSILFVQATAAWALFAPSGADAKRAKHAARRRAYYSRQELRTILPVALALTLMVAVPPMVNANVRHRSDNQLHAGIVYSVLNTGIPPEAPYLAGYNLYYYWFYDLANAITAYAGGLDATSAIYITNASGFFSLIVMMWLLSRSFGGDLTRNLMAVAFLAFGMNAYRGLEILQGLLNGSIVLGDIQGVGAVLYMLTGWGNASLLVGFLVGHAPALTLAFIATGLYSMSEYRKGGDRVYLASLFLCTFGAFGFHPPTGIYFCLAVGIYAVLEFIFRSMRTSTAAGIAAAAAVVLLIPYSVQITSSKEGDIWANYLRVGDISAYYKANGAWNAVSYALSPLQYLISTHLQIVSVFAAAGLVIGLRRLNLVLLSALAAFTATYVLVNTPGGSWKNTELLMIPLAILASWPAAEAAKRIPYVWGRRLFLAALVLVLAPTDVITVWGYSTSMGVPADDTREAVYSWIAENTPTDGVFIFSTNHYAQFMSYSGRSSFVFNKFWRLHGYDEEVIKDRQTLINDIEYGRSVDNDSAKICNITQRPTYVVMTPQHVGKAEAPLEKFSDADRFVVNMVPTSDGNASIVELKCDRIIKPSPG